MVAEPWIFKVRSQVGNNIRNAFYMDKNNSKKQDRKEIIGILSFEVAGVISKTIQLHKSLTDKEIFRLKNEIMRSESIRNLVSEDDGYLLELVLVEKLDDLNCIANVVSRLGKKCSEPALLGFEHVYADLLGGKIEIRDLGFLVKNMEGVIRKMEKYVNLTSNLSNKLDVLNKLEQSMKKFQNNPNEESRKTIEQKVNWHKQDARHLRDVSLWNQTYDKIVRILARMVCNIFVRICFVFGDSGLGFSFRREGSPPLLDEGRESSSLTCTSYLHQLDSSTLQAKSREGSGYRPGSTERVSVGSSIRSVRSKLLAQNLQFESLKFPCASNPGKLLMECLSISSSLSKPDDDIVHTERESNSRKLWDMRRAHSSQSSCSDDIRPSTLLRGDILVSRLNKSPRHSFGLKNRIIKQAPVSTVGGSALAFHYANVIIVIEKLLRYPHLVGEEARDDLYQMLPTSLRMSLRTNLKSYTKNMAIYDASLAHDWKDVLEKTLQWLGPMAHNMIRWQTERNFEQRLISTKANILLLQTLYYADREKTEAAIGKLLIGLNYICRYEQQKNALLDCTSSLDFDDYMEWRSRFHSLID